MPTIDQQVQRKKPKTQTRTQPRTQRHRDPRKTPGSTTVSSPGPNKDIPGLVWYSGMAWQGGRGRGGGREGGRRQWKREGVGVGESAICSISSPPPILPTPSSPPRSLRSTRKIVPSSSSPAIQYTLDIPARHIPASVGAVFAIFSPFFRVPPPARRMPLCNHKIPDFFVHFFILRT